MAYTWNTAFCAIPAGTDDRRTADDHIRRIKSELRKRLNNIFNFEDDPDSGGYEMVLNDGIVKEDTITLSDVTTHNVSTTKHGFAPKAPDDTTKFLRGDAAWAAPPSLINVQLITIGTTTYTKTAGATKAIVLACAGGGGGGDALVTNTAGTGGGAGSMGMLYISSLNNSYPVSIGAGGGHSANGGNTTFGNPALLTCYGGGGGLDSQSGNGAGGAQGALSVGGTLNRAGQDGGRNNGTSYSGAGANGWYGAGGASRTTDGAGYNGTGYGSGGGGALNKGTNRNGGSGTPGFICVFEYA